MYYRNVSKYSGFAVYYLVLISNVKIKLVCVFKTFMF